MSKSQKETGVVATQDISSKQAPEGHVYLWAPMIGRRLFNKKHAEKLLKLEESTPSGWVKWTDQPIEIKKSSEA